MIRPAEDWRWHWQCVSEEVEQLRAIVSWFAKRAELKLDGVTLLAYPTARWEAGWDNIFPAHLEPLLKRLSPPQEVSREPK